MSIDSTYTMELRFEAGDLGYVEATATFETDTSGEDTKFISIVVNSFTITREILIAMTCREWVEKWECEAAQEFYINNSWAR